MAKSKNSKDTALQTFFKENKSLALMLPLLAVMIIVMIFVYAGGGKDANIQASGDVTPAPSQSSAAIPTDQPKVEVLPQLERQGDGTENAETTKDPFAAPMKLTGIITNSAGDASAIIESAGNSFIVKSDEVIGESTWKVLSIYENSVMLDSGGKSMLLELNKEDSQPVPSEPANP